MILVGDIIKQTKEIMGFDYVGTEFEEQEFWLLVEYL